MFLWYYRQQSKCHIWNGGARALKRHVVILKEENAEKPKSDYLLDFYSTFKKDAYITLEEAVDKNLKA